MLLVNILVTNLNKHNVHINKHFYCNNDAHIVELFSAIKHKVLVMARAFGSGLCGLESFSVSNSFHRHSKEVGHFAATGYEGVIIPYNVEKIGQTNGLLAQKYATKNMVSNCINFHL